MQISDPHFGTERPAVVEALVRLTQSQAPDIVVLSGDITQRATRAQFRAARHFVDRLHADRLLTIPGNHDIPLLNLPLRAIAPYANHRRAFGFALEPEFESPQWLVVALNTTRPSRHKNGEVSRAQIERVAHRLAGAQPGQVRVVVVHQPVAVTREEDTPDLLRGHAHAIHRWAEAGADLVLGGHIHLPFVVALHERDSHLPRKLWAVQAGTAVSSRVRHEAGNSINLMRHAMLNGERLCLFERWDYAPASDRFEVVQMRELACSR